MKKLIIIFALALTMGCEKQNCYKCLVTYWDGTRVNKDYCGALPAYFQDDQGNDLQSYCEPK